MGASEADFFVTYSHPDESHATWIAAQLEAARYRCVIQAWDFGAGRNFVSEMNRALEQARRVLMVLSPAYVASPYTEMEWTAALEMSTRGRPPPLGVLVERTDNLPSLLRTHVYVDIVGLPEEEARERLIEAVRDGRRKPSEAVPFPGVASVRNIALGPLPTFLGRDSLLAELRARLESAPHPAVVALTGMAGVGKTRIAVEHARRNADSYDIAWWVPAEERSAAEAAFAQLRQALGIPQAQDSAQTVSAVHRALASRGRWLLVFDNAAEPAAVAGLLPPAGDGHVLITSRDPAWRGVASVLEIPVLERDDAVALLGARGGSPGGEAAGALASRLGDLPLALQQAGAYMEATGESADGYLDLLSDDPAAVLERGAPSDYGSPIAAVWNLTLGRIAKTSPAAVQLLRLLSFLAPDPLPRGVLLDGAAHLPSPLREAAATRLGLNDLVTTLSRYALIEPGEGLATHRLLQEVVREAVDAREAAELVDAALTLIAGSFPAGASSPRTWPLATPLLPHAERILAHAAQRGIADERVIWLLLRVGSFLREVGVLLPALGVYTRAEELARTAGDHGFLAEAAGGISRTYLTLGDFERAETYAAEAVRLSEGDEETTALATALTDHAQVLRELHRFEEARAQAQRSLDVSERLLGPDHPQLAYRLNTLGMAQQDLGQLAEAEKSLRRGLRLLAQTGDPPSGLNSSLLNNLAVTLRKAGRLDEADTCATQAIDLVRQLYGPRHWGLVRALTGLGRLRIAQGRPADAIRVFDEALDLARSALPPDHPHVAEIEADRATARRQLAS